jgi:23S rRNA (cytidine1920-2'-O)/16S rRNA (cytidine1409-2'-O)-methyltransferase
MGRAKTGKKRLDVLLVERGLAESRHKAQARILAGQVRVAGEIAVKSGAMVDAAASIELAGGARFVSRSGEKLDGALEELRISVAGKICLDAGASTGGFTDCLLQRGARQVIAVDVSTDQLDWRLRQDARVRVVEANARHLRAQQIGEPVNFITADLSFISLVKVLPALAAVAAPEAEFLLLVKPQFELERKDVGRGGIVRDARLHEKAIQRVRHAAESLGLRVLTIAPSRVKGAEGNQEFFLHAQKPGPEQSSARAGTNGVESR